MINATAAQKYFRSLNVHNMTISPPAPRPAPKENEMSNWRNRIRRDKVYHVIDRVSELSPEFVAEITAAQIEANKGWAPDIDGLIDRRVTECPKCLSLGMNTCWGYWAFECGFELTPDGDESAPCNGDRIKGE